MSSTDTDCGLLIEADLTVGLPKSVVRLHSEGETLYVEARSFAALGELRSTAASEAVDWLRHRGLDSPLTVETPVVVRVRGVPVARYRPPGSPGRLADLLGVAPFDVDLGGVLRAAVRRLGR